ncbi:MAG: cystathionine beta-lyase [Alphaproteobacteria bacterium]|nr:cystathionine beta-lyase [Hyphomonas sp.]MBR9807847.1 cystathionine beta-lyase [Alphaproteobacteria bacterium]|tara:strand:+ start:877 stop:2034 length:1158 start_codon:yes stop_codon:yes gene_type:complete
MSKQLETRIIHTRKDRLPSKTVNPPVERASTLLFDTADRLYGAKPGYGRMGLTVHRELEAALCELENARQVRLTSNGLQACALAIGSQVKAGDHVLYSDSTYGPTSRFCERRLQHMGVESTRFDPRIGAGIEDLIQPNTKLIYLEAPGSLTFEISDTPAIVEVARKHGIRTALDNTWGAGLHHKPLDLGVDISVQALTKYVVGHSDVFAGAVMTRDPRIAQEVADTSDDWGISLSPDDAYTALRGLRSLATRLKAHEAAGLEVANWLTHRPEVAQVIHPALPTHPDHAIWKRDFTGACGLFSFILKDTPPEAVDKFIAALSLFSMGFSWGGFESLIIPCDQQLTRMQDSWTQTRAGPLMRIHIGLEATSDLLADLEAGFAAMADA